MIFGRRDKTDPQPKPAVEKSWLGRLTEGLSRSSQKLTQGLTDIVTKKKLDQETLDQLEEALIAADLGPHTAKKVIAAFGKDRFGRDLSEDDIRSALGQAVATILAPVARPLEKPEGLTGPFVVLVCGVNGAGKTTTIGKMAHNFSARGEKVMIAAADTFRAAAIEQLEVWARRSGADFFSKGFESDAAATAYESYLKAKEQGCGVLFIDTAGRLQNKANLMAELQKIVRVLKKHDDSLPHAVLLVLDATTGQNAHSQVEIFKEMVNVSGLIVTKLDGTAKGGVVVGLADRFGLPIHLVGVGEGIDDLQPFSAADFAAALAGVHSAP